jgi:DNA mismatch repair protein MutS2
MRSRDLVALEFPRVCAHVAEFAATTAGRAACAALQPAAEPGAADAELERSWQALRLLERGVAPPLAAVADVREHLRAAAHEGFVLDGKGLVEIRTMVVEARRLGAFLRAQAALALAGIADRLHEFPPLERSLLRTLDDEGGVRDEASDELVRVRSTIRGLRDTLSARLERLVNRRSLADAIGDTYVTIRNNRFVIPLRAEAVGRVAGVVQDRSASGETLFVEPLFAVDLNNELLLAVKEEEAIVRCILADLTALVRAERDALDATFAAFVEADVVFARARFAQACRCTRPTFSDGEIVLREARHAGLLFTGRPVTPIDLLLPADRPVLVITGPNTGGKTVALKTLGLSALMAQSGLLVPAAEGARLPCFAAIFADVGDEQNIERDLSTFSAHIVNLREIFDRVPSRALVLLDEPGVGTDPEEGAALAIGLLRRFEELGAHLAVTTHFAAVKAFALGRDRCTVAAVSFDLDAMTPRYRLAYHTAGRSLALPIAERLGLPEPVLVAARAAQTEGARAFDEAVRRLEEARQQLEAQLADAETRAAAAATHEAEAQRLRDEAATRQRTVWSEELRAARAFVRQVKEEGRAILAALREQTADRVALERVVSEHESTVATRERDFAADAAAPSGPLRVGQPVEVGDRGIRGELLAVEGERAWIQRGALRFEVRAAELRPAAPAPAREAVHVQIAPPPDVTPEISLLGLRARDAVEELRRFLDHAVRVGHPTVRVIHGVGSGALRRAVHEHLAASSYCSAFRSGEPAEGGGGVTIATLDV